MLQFSGKIMHCSGIVSDSCQILSFSKSFGEIPTKFYQNLASKRQSSIGNCSKNLKNHYSFSKKLTVFHWHFEIGAVQRCDYFVDLGKCSKMRIWTQKSASIQKRTSLPKFEGELFNIIHSPPYRRRVLRTGFPRSFIHGENEFSAALATVLELPCFQRFLQICSIFLKVCNVAGWKFH